MIKELTLALLILISIPAMAQTENLQVATFGSGCFWCSEAIFARVNGVYNVKPGYSGGDIINPSYKEVCTGRTGHAEVIQLEYNQTIVSYAQLLEIFFKTHDPTQLNRQGNDIGTQYRSVIYYHSDEQKQLAEDIKGKLNSEGIWDTDIVTEISPFANFYQAEPYHDDYYANNPNQGYCQFVITPKVEKFEKLFKSYLKQE